MQYQCVFSKKKKDSKEANTCILRRTHTQTVTCMYTVLLRGHCCNWMSDYCQIACVHVCVSLCVCRGGGTFLCQREGCCNSRVKAREINTQKSYREYQTEKWACSLFVISELNVDLVIFICCLASNHPLLISLPLALYATSFHLSVLFHFLLP